MRTKCNSYLCGSNKVAAGVLMERKQNGFVLIVAMIVLAAMSLAAVSLVRTVDTSTLLARNISFQRDAIGRSDAGIEAALQKFRLGGTYYGVLGLKAVHETDSAAQNYSSIMLSADGDGVPTILKSSSFNSTWTAAPIELGESTIGYYIIERSIRSAATAKATCSDSAVGHQVSNPKTRRIQLTTATYLDAVRPDRKAVAAVA